MWMKPTAKGEVALAMMRELLAAHGLVEWKAALSHSHGALGYCHRRKMTVYVNAHHVEHDPFSDVIDTIRHEVAHALTPRDAPAHGFEWQMIAARLGATPKPCMDHASLMPKRWTATCPCGKTHTKNRIRRDMLNRYVCRFCKARLVWTKHE